MKNQILQITTADIYLPLAKRHKPVRIIELTGERINVIFSSSAQMQGFMEDILKSTRSAYRKVNPRQLNSLAQAMEKAER